MSSHAEHSLFVENESWGFMELLLRLCLWDTQQKVKKWKVISVSQRCVCEPNLPDFTFLFEWIYFSDSLAQFKLSLDLSRLCVTVGHFSENKINWAYNLITWSTRNSSDSLSFHFLSICGGKGALVSLSYLKISGEYFPFWGKHLIS